MLLAAALVPCLLALGANVPGYETLWRRVPGLDATRVPERFMPIACLAIAALVAFGVQLATDCYKRVPAAAVAAVAIALLAVDLRVPVFGAVAADTPSAAYAAIRGDGRLLELPVFRPDVHYGSAYLGYARQSPRERPQGYSTLAPPAADKVARAARALVRARHDAARARRPFRGCPRRPVRRERVLRRGLRRARRARLEARGWRVLRRDGRITVLAR